MDGTAAELDLELATAGRDAQDRFCEHVRQRLRALPAGGMAAVSRLAAMPQPNVCRIASGQRRTPDLLTLKRLWRAMEELGLETAEEATDAGDADEAAG